MEILNASGVQWRNWSSALKEAKQTKKIIMVDTMKDGCSYCLKMESNVFKKREFAEYLEKNFIPVKINISHMTMPQELNVGMTPTFYFFNHEQKLIKRVPGSWNEEDFKYFLNEVIRLKREKGL